MRLPVRLPKAAIMETVDKDLLPGLNDAFMAQQTRTRAKHTSELTTLILICGISSRVKTHVLSVIRNTSTRWFILAVQFLSVIPSDEEGFQSGC